MDGDTDNPTLQNEADAGAASVETPASTPEASPSAAPPLPSDSRPNTPPAAPVAQPTIVKPQHRGGLAGIVDEFRDAVAGPAPGRVYTDQDGHQYIQHPDSAGNKWLRIAGEAARGAAAGAANGQGPGGKWKAAEAGINAGDKTAAMRSENEKNMSEEVKQANLEKFNSIKLKHDLAAQEFTLGRLKVKANQDDIDFSEKQIDREHQLGSADLGVYKDEADLAKVKQQHPDFWKSVYENNVHVVPELDDKGNRLGIHVFLRTPGIGSQLVSAGTPIKVFTPGKNPTDAPTLTEQVPTVAMTHDMVDAYNNAAMTKYNDWHKNKGEEDYKAQQTQTSEAEEEEKRAGANKVPSEINRNNAEAAKLRADAALTGNSKKPDGSWDEASIPVSLVEADMDPTQMTKRTKDYNEKLVQANQYSMEKYGHRFDLAQAQADYKFANLGTTQNTMKMINGMTDPGGSIEIARNAAKALPKYPEATINKMFNATATEFGSKEATDFHTSLLGLADEYAKVMGAGQGSDLSRQQALDLLKAEYSRGQLGGAINIIQKDLAARRSAVIGNNRYLMKQYPVYARAPGKPRMQSTDGGKSWHPAP